jgi:hypothetical protein
MILGVRRLTARARDCVDAANAEKCPIWAVCVKYAEATQ